MIVCLRRSWGHVFVLALLLFAATACSTSQYGRSSTGKPEVSAHYKVGKPYRVKGKWYRPAEDKDYEASGIASWYGRDFHGKATANGERFDMNRLSAAHTTLPLPSLVEVTNLGTGQRIVVRVNDRGPFANNRLIDLSREAARQLGFEHKGLAKVKVRYVGPAPLQAKAPKFNQRVIATASAQPLAHTVPSAASTPTSDQSLNSAQRIARIPLPSLTKPKPVFSTIASPVSYRPPPTGGSSASPLTSSAAIAHTPAQLYLIRVAVLSSLDNIEMLKEQLRDIGQLRMSRIESDLGSVLYRINMGPFTSLEIANKRLEAVRGAGYKDAGLITLTP